MNKKWTNVFVIILVFYIIYSNQDSFSPQINQIKNTLGLKLEPNYSYNLTKEHAENSIVNNRKEDEINDKKDDETNNKKNNIKDGEVIKNYLEKFLEKKATKENIKYFFKNNNHNLSQENIIENKNLLYKNPAINDIENGQGESAQCGDKIKLSYITLDTDNNPINQKSEQIFFTIGEGKYNKYLERSIIGMKKGGKRKIVLPSNTILVNEKESDNKEEYLILNVELTEIINLYKKQNQLIVCDKSNNNSKDFIKCGDDIEILYKVYDLENNLIYDQEFFELPKRITIGDNNIPYGLNQALEGMLYNSERTVIIPRNYLNKKDFFPKNINFPQQNSLIFKIKAGKISQ